MNDPFDFDDMPSEPDDFELNESYGPDDFDDFDEPDERMGSMGDD